MKTQNQTLASIFNTVKQFNDVKTNNVITSISSSYNSCCSVATASEITNSLNH
jgi:hypothetical protein